MPFTTPDYPDIRDAILRDIANQLPGAAVGSDSDYAIRANAVAAAIEGLYQHQQWIARQILPDTADDDYLERWASLFEIQLKAASVASGTITFTGTPGAPVLVGTEARTSAGVAYVTTAADTIPGGGSIAIAAQAVVPGAAGNADAATQLTLTSAPSGVDSAATITLMTGGTDVETPASLLDRLLYRIRKPPHGGAKHDYEAWAREVPGVERAYVFSLRRGDGTVDVVPLPASGQPSAQLIASVQTHIDMERPATADFLAFGPAEVQVDVTAALVLDGITLAATSDAIQGALVSYFATLAPGDTVYRSKIAALISDIDGVVDFTLTSPAANVTTTVDDTAVELAVLGTVSLS
ncbi:baseplate J/gp47 family protein [Denitromonas halophila]|uniref:Baseplate J/gp47 family protein n=1 Tax=Denitromonas halophila TaxID=1629404 RepID=A0A557QX82_9RHOO|nr:baseplate J/gp47 family protein [Denitromonas halophila]TVO57517.1 baseplate J/gp47 family protein [Denitromonas halophila]